MPFFTILNKVCNRCADRHCSHISPQFEGLWIFAETYHKFREIYMPSPTHPSVRRPSVRSSLFGAISLAWLPFLFSCCLPPSHGLFLYGVGRVSILKEYLSLKVFRLYASPFSGQVERSLFYFACSFSNLEQCFYQILHSWHPAEYMLKVPKAKEKTWKK